MLTPEERGRLDRAGGDLSRGLVLALVAGAVVFLGLVVWFLRVGGGIWG